MFYKSIINLVDHTIRIGDIIFGLLGISICVYARIKMRSKQLNK
jgi:hypothetical protein